MDVEQQQNMADQLWLFGEEAVVCPLGNGEAGSRSADVGERQTSSVSDGNRALATDIVSLTERYLTLQH